jgi:RNA-directed DNA polymerase
MQLGIKREEAWKWANTRKGYARVAKSQVLRVTITNKRLKKFGLVSLLDQYQKVHI